MSPASTFSTPLLLEFADPEFEKQFRVYSNYLQDMAGLIASGHGFDRTLAEGVVASVAAGPAAARARRRRLTHRESVALDLALRKAWQNLRRVVREAADTADFDMEANAWLPAQAYYAVYHAVLAFAVASGQQVPRNHTPALRLAGDEVRRGTLPFPWSAHCLGCPQTEATVFGGMAVPASVHPLSSPKPENAPDRLAMFLRTTRQKEIERLLDAERAKGVKPGGSRRRISAAEKERLAQRVPPTTMFDLFWRLRKKAHYDDADTFVLGAAGTRDAAAFAQALSYVTDGTLAALEGLIAAYVGPRPLADTASAYAKRCSSPVIRRRAELWTGQLAARTRVITRGHS